MSVKDINYAIEQKAKERLNKDIEGLKKIIEGNKLINNIPFQIKGKSLFDTLPRLLYWEGDGRLIDYIRSEWLNRYIEEETILFVKKVDSLQEQINDLHLCIQNQDEYP